LKAQSKLTVGELGQVIGQSTLPAMVAARFSLILSLLAVLLSATALAIALVRR
jgi:hypothetical protein